MWKELAEVNDREEQPETVSGNKKFEGEKSEGKEMTWQSPKWIVTSCSTNVI